MDRFGISTTALLGVFASIAVALPTSGCGVVCIGGEFASDARRIERAVEFLITTDQSFQERVPTQIDGVSRVSFITHRAGILRYHSAREFLSENPACCSVRSVQGKAVVNLKFDARLQEATGIRRVATRAVYNVSDCGVVSDPV